MMDKTAVDENGIDKNSNGVHETGYSNEVYQ